MKNFKLLLILAASCVITNIQSEVTYKKVSAKNTKKVSAKNTKKIDDALIEMLGLPKNTSHKALTKYLGIPQDATIREVGFAAGEKLAEQAAGPINRIMNKANADLQKLIDEESK